MQALHSPLLHTMALPQASPFVALPVSMQVA
jgi:hypothetical protein